MDQLTIDIPDGLDAQKKAELADRLRRLAHRLTLTSTPSDDQPVSNFYEAASRVGLIGGGSDYPTDLSSNADHLDGFGQ